MKIFWAHMSRSVVSKKQFEADNNKKNTYRFCKIVLHLVDTFLFRSYRSNIDTLFVPKPTNQNNVLVQELL